MDEATISLSDPHSPIERGPQDVFHNEVRQDQALLRVRLPEQWSKLPTGDRKMSADVLAAVQARKEIHEEFGEDARIQDHVSEFLARVHFYTDNQPALEEKLGYKIAAPLPSEMELAETEEETGT